MIKKVIKSKEEIYNDVLEVYVNEINKNPEIVLGLATGSTPEPLYKKLIEAYNDSKISFSKVETFNLDEYEGIKKENEQSYYSFMNKNLFSKVDIKKENINMPPNKEEGIEEYEKKLNEKKIDIQLLGIGSNGHIAFNEPGTPFNTRTHKVKLAQKTIDDNSRFFDKKEDVPTEAISMGLANIMEAKKIILIAIGETKAEIIKELFSNDNISEQLPASILKKHEDVTIYMDQEAAKLI